MPFDPASGWVLALGPQLHADHVGPGPGLGHGERAQVFAGNQPGQEPRLLVRRAVAVDLVDAKVGMGAVGQRHRGRGAGDFLHRHAMREVAHGGTPVVRVRRNAEQTELAHLRPQVAGEFVGFVDLGGARRDLVLRKAENHVAQGLDLVAQGKGHAGGEHSGPPK